MRSKLDAVTERGKAASFGGGEDAKAAALAVDEEGTLALDKTWTAPRGRLRCRGELSSLREEDEAWAALCIDVELDNGSRSVW